MRGLTSNEIHRALRKALEQVTLRLESGTLDHSGRYYPENELGSRRVASKVRRKASSRTKVASRRNPKSA